MQSCNFSKTIKSVSLINCSSRIVDDISYSVSYLVKDVRYDFICILGEIKPKFMYTSHPVSKKRGSAG